MQAWLRKAIKHTAIPVAQRLGLLSLIHRWRHRHSLTVVMFHRVLPLDSDDCRHAEREYVIGTDEFERCLAFFARHYSVVTLADLERAARKGMALPARPLLITFDDGWRDNVVHAEPALRRHRMKATLFVNVDAVRQPGQRWWQDALVEAVEKPVLETPAAEAPAGGGIGPGMPARADFFTALACALRRPLNERLPAVLPRTSWVPATRQMLTIEELASLDPAVWEVGSHGVTHAPLTHVRDPEGELTESWRLLSRWQPQPVRAISMPHGRYSTGIARVARGIYALVFTSDPFLTLAQASSLQNPIGRIHVPSSACSDDAALGRFLWLRRQR